MMLRQLRDLIAPRVQESKRPTTLQRCNAFIAMKSMSYPVSSADSSQVECRLVPPVHWHLNPDSLQLLAHHVDPWAAGVPTRSGAFRT
jgi:hypothetical protein